MASGSTTNETGPDLDPESPFVRAPEALWRQVGGVILVRTVSDPKVVELFGTGVLLWLCLREPTTADELATELSAVVGVPVDVVAPDVHTALADLLRRGVVMQVEKT